MAKRKEDRSTRALSNNVKVELESVPTDLVAEIPPETIAKILELIGRLSILIDRSSAAERSWVGRVSRPWLIPKQLKIFNTYGETEEVAYVLEQLNNTKERGEVAYTRLTGLLLKVSRFQPSAPMAMVEMLTQSIEIAEAIVDAGEATVKEATID